MSSQKFLIHKFSHFYVVYLRDIRFQRLVFEFTHQFVDYVDEYEPKTRRYIKKPRVWAGRLADNSLFRFPIGTLSTFEKFLRARGVPQDEIDYKVEPYYVPAPANFKLNAAYTPRDYQYEAVNYAVERRSAGAPSVLLSKPPGSGKTVTFAYFLELMKLRAAIVIPATYMDKWVADAEQYLDLESSDVYQIRGSKSIRQAVEMVKADEFDKDFTIISLRTYGDFMKAYEASPSRTIDEYGTDPISLWCNLRLGVLGGDEVHEQFFAMHWFQTFLHGVFHMGLSATMLDDSSFIEDRQKAIYPHSLRFDKIKMKRYIVMLNIEYRFETFDKDRIKINYPRNSSYSQNAYEDSIYKNKKVLKNFLAMVRWSVETFFFHATHQPGDKLGIYFASIQMLNVVVAFLKQEYPHLDIRRFAQDDPYINLIEPDVRVTTQGSGGTGKDIKALTTVLNYNCMKSRKGNIQLLGRIREIEGRDDLYFVQFNCGNIKKHTEYRIERNKELADKTKSISHKSYGPTL